ncbi:MAG: ATP-binding protein [Bacteroidales bacterium]|nr:ATP-binding protein [Bacteroidales bacterium]
MKGINVIRRSLYIDRIVKHFHREMMIVLVGQRRVGKSYILYDLKNWIEENEPDSNILYLDKEQRMGESLMTSDELYNLAIEKLPEDGRNYLLIDEVQNIENYEIALRNLYAEERTQIIVTGSNAHVFSSELGTRLGARYIEMPIFSLTYPEFLTFHKLEDSETSLRDYLTVGGLPGLRNYDIHDLEVVEDFHQGVYNTIMMKDVIERENIRNVLMMKNLSHFMADTIGKMVSPNSIAGTIISQGIKTTGQAISTYLSYLNNALICIPVYRYDLHGKHLLEENYKYYFSDHGIRNYLCGYQSRKSIERIIENVIWNHLRAQRFEVNVGILPKGEVDFVATKANRTIYVQATYLLSSDEVIAREFGNLKAIDDNYPKYVVSMDPIPGEIEDYPGIIHLHIRDFLKAQLST